MKIDLSVRNSCERDSKWKAIRVSGFSAIVILSLERDSLYK